MKQPEYFEKIRSASERRWQQLEADPELAGPWHQLFKQVQSPRHIISELLQNADDANATEAIVNIENGVFTFEHNGDDFIESHFASICRFGYSNKRALHTIGFRGIGFKSTFSLGDKVYLNTPTLSVAFNNKRFTLPYWTDRKYSQSEKTYVSVKIKSEQIESELLKNLKEWLNSPYSLLFFKNIRSLTISGTKVEWKSVGAGPVSNSEWMALDGNLDKPYLVVRSKPQFFPPEALAEIQQERMTGSEDASNDFPPCNIDIVLGAEGRLYVVLPTGVQTQLPFACNAPFIQDPARLKIKDPETSPTNQWLLQRAGVLAAEAMMAWLSQQKTNGDAKELSYNLMPDVDREDASLEGLCGATVELAFEAAIENKPIVLTSENKLIAAKEGFHIPRRLLTIWEDQVSSELFESPARPLISTKISKSNLDKLSRWNLIESLTKHKLYERLRGSRLPQPNSWKQLLILWDYLSPDIISYRAGIIGDLAIVPVNGQSCLYSANDVVRLGEKRLVRSEEDWLFLSPYLKVMNQNWTRFLTEEKRKINAQGESNDTKVENASRVLDRLQLNNTDEIGAVLDKVSAKFFEQDEKEISDCIKLSQIYAKLNAPVGASFKYVNNARNLRTINEVTLRDENGWLEYLIPNKYQDQVMLHDDYEIDFSSCSKEEWIDWARSEKSHLASFIPLEETSKHLYGRKQASEIVLSRSGPEEIDFPYKTQSFELKDWDYPEHYWEHWHQLESENKNIWSQVMSIVLNQRPTYWRRARSAKMLQIATTGSRKSTTNYSILPNWVLKFQELPCFNDKYKTLLKPNDIYRRTKSTEAFRDTEPFIEYEFEKENLHTLLDMLGVQKTPPNATKFVERIRALSGGSTNALKEVEKWYSRIDEYLNTAHSIEIRSISNAFRSEKLIATNDGSWQTSGSAFIFPDEDVLPGAPVILPGLTELSLWNKIGVPDRPSSESAIKWLKALPIGQALDSKEALRVRNVCRKYPRQIWQECGSWISITGQWRPNEAFSYSMSMQSLASTQNIFAAVADSVADFKMLSAEVYSLPPFNAVTPFRDALEEVFDDDWVLAECGERPDWLSVFASLLVRIKFSNEQDSKTILCAAQQFSQLEIRTVESIVLRPFIEGKPVGSERKTDALLDHTVLYLTDVTNGKKANLIPKTLGDSLPVKLLGALHYSYERNSNSITEYMSENFDLGAPAIELSPTGETQLLAGVDALKDTVLDDVYQSSEPKTSIPLTIDEQLVAEIGNDSDTNSMGDEISGSESEDESHQVIKSRTVKRKKRRSLIELYAASLGYELGADGVYVDLLGNRIRKSSNSQFQWVFENSDDNSEQKFITLEHCLDREPLTIASDVWHMIEQRPSEYGLILIDHQGHPERFSGTHLLELKNTGQIALNPAKYRISKTDLP